MFSKLIRLGRDAEIRFTKGGKSVTGFSGAYDIGWGDNKKTQWIECSFWGDRGSNIAEYLTKGSQVVIHASDIHVDVYNDKLQLKCTVQDVELISGQQQSKPAAMQTEHMQTEHMQTEPSVDEFDDSIPF
ncbi:single-stranded DNA-binding protein [bacterium]|nr:single-stranded DNA-binding protein [bacterium]